MAKYIDLKRETLRFVDYYSYQYEVQAGYLKPPEEPQFSAATALDDVGMNRNMRKGLAQAANYKLPQALGGSWSNVTVLELAGSESIGDLIKLFCACSKTGLPEGEPT